MTCNSSNAKKMLLGTSFLILLTLHAADLCRILKPVKSHVLVGHVTKTIPNSSFEKCTYYCELDTKCISVNYFIQDGKCEFNNARKEMFPCDLKEKEDAIYVQNIRKDDREIDPCKWLKCQHGGSCQPLPKPWCACLTAFKGSTCQTVLLKGLGVQDDNVIGDGQLTSSTAMAGHEAWRGRLNGSGSWKPEINDRTPVYRVAFNQQPVNITFIATQGDPDEDFWVTSFTLQYKMKDHENPFTDYPQTFLGNTDRDTVVYHPLRKGHLVGVTSIRIYPSSSLSCMALRLELYK